ncbi:MAG: hypothetical protein OEU25_18475, partial [Rhodospirillales bacterium]|nr:hypothetical protein [Rhodospirillales bacterium]
GAEGAGRRVSVVVRLAEPSDRLPALVEALPDCEVISADESAAKVMMPAPALERHRALKRLVDEGLAVAAFEEVRPDLQEAYLAHLREEPQS